MAKKKDKPQIINNIQELNLEIDYDKLAQAIVKAQEKSKDEKKPSEKTGFWKAVGLIIINKEEKSGKRTAFVLADVLANIFNLVAIIGVLIAGIFIYVSIFELSWNIAIVQIIAQAAFAVVSIFLSLSISLVFRAMANEIKVESDRNYITTLFFGFTSLASLIVALVALFKGVG